MANYINRISRTTGFRYIIVGLLANGLYFALYVWLYRLLASAFFASLAAYLATLAFSYALSSNWTFVNPKALSPSKRRITFAGVYVSSAIIMAFIIETLSDIGLDYRLSWLFGTGYAVIHNFILSKNLVFKS